MSGHRFTDAALDASFRRDGFVIVDLLSPAEVRELEASVRQLLPPSPPLNDPQGAAYASFFDLERRAAVSALVRDTVQPAIAKLLAGYRPLFSTIFWKPAGRAETPIHQHSPYTADLRCTVINCWCPLIDCDETSGTLQLVPRSHDLSRHVQTPSRKAYWQDYADVLESDYLKALAVRAGQAVLFDDTILHGAAANQRAEDRLATLTTMIPEAGTPAFVLGAQDSEAVDVYQALDHFAYSDMFTGQLAPERSRRLARVEQAVEHVDLEEFRRRLRARGVTPQTGLASRFRAGARKLMKATPW